MNARYVTLAAILTLAMLPAAGRADIFSKGATEAVEYLLKKFGKEVAEEGVERLTTKIAAAASRHGDDVIAAVRKIGPRALTLADEAGENAPRAMRLVSRYGDDAARVLSQPKGMAIFTRYGDDAAEVLIKHKGIAEPLVESLGEPAVKALGNLGARNGRRLAMMTKDLTTGGQAAALLEVIARHGDPAMEFLWRHKGVLAGGAMLAAFIANPEPYLSGTDKLVGTLATTTITPAIEAAAVAVQPAIQSAGHAVSEGFALLRWALVAAVILLALTGFGAVKSGLPWKAAAKCAVGRIMERFRL